MPKRYTQTERDFVLALALATKKPFTHLAPIIQALAKAQMLAWLSPRANERFLDWPAERGYVWAKEYNWNLNDLETDQVKPLPPEEEIDDQILRDRIDVKDLLLARIKSEIGDPHKNSNAFVRVTDQIEHQITRRMSRAMTPQTIFELVFRVINRLKGHNPDEQTVLQTIAEEVSRFKYLPPGTNEQTAD